MDVAPLFLLLLLPPADTTGDMAAGIQASLRREVGEVAMAIAPDPLVTPAMWRGDQAKLRARFVVRVEWTTRDRATITLLASPSPAPAKGASRERALEFSPEDGRSERGRAVGLVLAELLRESPASAFIAATPASTLAQPATPVPPRLVPGALFATQRVMSGNWAMGPELTYGFGLTEAWCLRASGWTLFGSADSYLDLGLGLGLRWDLLRAGHGRHVLGLGVGGEFFHESAGSSEDGKASGWNAALGGGLTGRVTIWRFLRLVGEVDLRVPVRTMSLTVGEDANRRTHSYSRWRPGFAVGLELVM